MDQSSISRLFAAAYCAALLPCIASCAASEPAMTIRITSSAFRDSESIPKQYTGDGEDVSPPLAWSNLPPGTRELALVCDDPDAPSAEPWVHWVIYQIAPETTDLPQGVGADPQPAEPAGARQGKNSWTSGRTIGYRGPAPPAGKTHHYRFRLYALDAPLDLEPGVDAASLTRAMKGHVLAQGQLTGTYRR
jgi:Raf kinase inhibitor-like YbhB/YbcL family protein